MSLFAHEKEEGEGTKREYKLLIERRLKDVLLPFYSLYSYTNSLTLFSLHDTTLTIIID